MWLCYLARVQPAGKRPENWEEFLTGLSDLKLGCCWWWVICKDSSGKIFPSGCFQNRPRAIKNSLSHSVCVCVCVCVCLYSCTCACTHTCMCTSYMCLCTYMSLSERLEAEGWTLYHSPLLFILLGWGNLSLNLELIGSAWLDSKPQRFSCLCLPGLELCMDAGHLK